MCVCNGTVIVQVLTAFQVLNIDLKRFSSLAWRVSFMLAKHISSNYIKNQSYGDGSFLFFGRGGIAMLKPLENRVSK